MNEFDENQLTDIPEEYRELFKNIANSIKQMINERKLHYISNTSEFSDGVTIGIEIGAMYGDELHEIYKNRYSSNTNTT
jgi:hypothetical protein